MKHLPAITRMTLSAGAILFAATQAALAHDDHRGRVKLDGYSEVPAVSTQASGRLRVDVDRRGQQIRYQLSYEGLEADATQAHIHFGQRGVNGAVVVFLCSNLGNGPAGTQACPLRAGTVSGTLRPEDMVASATAQGLAPGDFAEFLDAIDEGVTYGNVHSTKFPGGEIRAQVR